MSNKKQGSSNYNKNILEKELENKKTGGFFDQFFGSSRNYPDRSSKFEQFPGYTPWQKKEQKLPQRLEFTVFKHENYLEKHIIPGQIDQLICEIRKEITAIKQSKKALMSEVENIEKVILQTSSEKPGVYHVRFLEILLSFLKVLRTKVGEAKTWLAAMMTKKKKRGSLFLALSNKKGTQYSLSSELQTARGVM
jgi:hypothetical protein